MPSAASQLISLDLFSSGQRNGFDLASSCYGSFSLLVGYDMLDHSALAMLEFLWDFNSKPGGILLIISHYLRNLRFVPSSLQTKANADGSLSSGRLEMVEQFFSLLVMVFGRCVSDMLAGTQAHDLRLRVCCQRK